MNNQTVNEAFENVNKAFKQLGQTIKKEFKKDTLRIIKIFKCKKIN